jgi:hypothetical protein
LAIAVAAFLLASCSEGDEAPVPERLADGRSVGALPVELERVDASLVLTAVEVVEAGDVPSASDVGACLASRPEHIGQRSPVVVRTAARSESVTVRDAAGRSLAACDGIPERSQGARTVWCGSSYGALFEGRLRDPRLDIGCVRDDGTTVGHLWVEADPKTAYVTVEQDGYVEVYEVAADLPVRVATEDVELDGSRATVEVLEHDVTGALVRRYRLAVGVAG